MINIVRSSFARFAIVSALSIVFASSAKAAFTFDADGAGGQASAVSITGLQYGAGNALAVGAIQNGGLQVGTTFQLLFQTHLAQLVNGSTTINPDGLDTDYQITLVASFTERVTSVTTIAGVGTFATFELVPSATDTINIYYNAAKVYDNAAGTGFAVGTVIASLNPNSLISSYFDVTTLRGTTDFNNFSTGNGVNATTNQGSGSAVIGAAVNSYDSNFFQPPSGTPQLISSIVDLGVDPVFNVIPASILFTNVSNNSVVVANIGANNGTSGPDFQLETSGFTQSFTVVPEPASVAMTVLGLGGAGLGSLAARRRRAQASA